MVLALKAVVWAVDIWKEVEGGNWNSNYDLFYRILDTSSGEFLSEEYRITDSGSNYIESVTADQNGGFNIVWEDDGASEYPYQLNVGYDDETGYFRSEVTSSAPEFETKDGQLIWNFGDARISLS